MPQLARSPTPVSTLRNVREVTVVVSEPWEFVDERRSNVFTATVRARSEDSVSLEIAGHLYVASPCGTSGA
jgi:hypothetical protein